MTHFPSWVIYIWMDWVQKQDVNYRDTGCKSSCCQTAYIPITSMEFKQLHYTMTRATKKLTAWLWCELPQATTCCFQMCEISRCFQTKQHKDRNAGECQSMVYKIIIHCSLNRGVRENSKRKEMEKFPFLWDQHVAFMISKVEIQIKNTLGRCPGSIWWFSCNEQSTGCTFSFS